MSSIAVLKPENFVVVGPHPYDTQTSINFFGFYSVRGICEKAVVKYPKIGRSTIYFHKDKTCLIITSCYRSMSASHSVRHFDTIQDAFLFASLKLHSEYIQNRQNNIAYAKHHKKRLYLKNIPS